jgi:hypothetical protein
MAYPRKIPPPTLPKLKCLETPMDQDEVLEHPESDAPPDRDFPPWKRNGHRVPPRQFTFIYEGTDPIGVYVGKPNAYGVYLMPPRIVPHNSELAEFVFHNGRRIVLTADSPLLGFLRGNTNLFRVPGHYEMHPEEN